MLVIIVSAVAALFAFATIPPRQTFTPDNLAYFDMASGKPAQAPFCFRILVPSIARLLPLSPPIALRLITYVCMAGVYLCGLYLCRLEGINLAASFGGLLLFYCSRPHLFTYYNPYLTDAAGWLAIFGLCITFVKRRYSYFIVIAAIGALVRESALFPCAAWLLNHRTRRLAAFLAIPAVAFLLPRFLVHSQQGYTGYLVSGVTAQSGLSVKVVFYSLFMSWGGLWIIACYGITRCSKELMALAAALSIGAIASSVVITNGDYERMLGVLAPMILVASAKTLQVARHASPLALRLLLCVMPVQFLFGNHYVLPTGDHVYKIGLAISTLLTTGIATLLVVLLVTKRMQRPASA